MKLFVIYLEIIIVIIIGCKNHHSHNDEVGKKVKIANSNNYPQRKRIITSLNVRLEKSHKNIFIKDGTILEIIKELEDTSTYGIFSSKLSVIGIFNDYYQIPSILLINLQDTTSYTKGTFFKSSFDSLSYLYLGKNNFSLKRTNTNSGEPFDELFFKDKPIATVFYFMKSYYFDSQLPLPDIIDTNQCFINNIGITISLKRNIKEISQMNIVWTFENGEVEAIFKKTNQGTTCKVIFYLG